MNRICMHRDDKGFALVASVIVVMVVSLLMLVMVAYAMTETRQTGRDRQRSSAVMTAEGGIDATLARIEGANIAAMPCGQTVTTTTESAPDTLTRTTTVKFYSSAGVEVTCAQVAAGTQVVEALVTSSAKSNGLANQSPAKRTMESLVRLTPSFTLDKAIFGDLGIVVVKNADVLGSDVASPDADVYSNGNFSCSSGEFRGSVTVKGTAALGSCKVAVDVLAKTGLTGSSSIGGQARVYQGNITLSSGATVAGTAKASGTISWAGCSTAGKCIAPYTDAEVFPEEPFPVLRGWNDIPTQQAWTAAGYTNVVTKNVCTGSDTPMSWLLGSAQTITAPTVLVTGCRVDFADQADIKLSNNVAVFATKGFYSKNGLSVASTTSEMRLFYMIQPFGSPCNPALGFDAKNSFTLNSTDRPANALIYTPCSVEMKNNSDHFGQIYSAGTVEFKNNMELDFVPMPVFGIQNVAPTYKVGIAYKRETG